MALEFSSPMVPKGRGPFVRRTELAGLVNAIRTGSSRPGLDRRTDCLLYNASGSELPEFSVLRIVDVMVAPSDGEEEYLGNTTFRGQTVDTAGELKIAILQQPASPGGLPVAVYAGVTLARLVGPEGKTFADPRAGETTLLAADTGCCVILVDPGPPEPEEGEEETDERIAVIRIDGMRRGGSDTPDPGGGFPIETSSCNCSDCYKGSAKHKCTKCGCINRRRYLALPELWDAMPKFVTVKYTGEGCIWESLPINGPICCNHIRQYFVRVDYDAGKVWLMFYGDPEEEEEECTECVGPCEFESAPDGDGFKWVPLGSNTCSCECTPPEDPPTELGQSTSGTCAGEPDPPKCPLIYIEWCLTDACGGGRRCTCPWIFQLDIHEGVDPPADCKLCVTPGQPRRESTISDVPVCGNAECIVKLGSAATLRIEGVYEAFGSEADGFAEYMADVWPLDDDHVASGVCCLDGEQEVCKQWGYIEGVQQVDAYDVLRPDLGDMAFDRWIAAWNIGAWLAEEGDGTYTVYAALYASSELFPNGSPPSLIQGSQCILAWKSASMTCVELKEATERGYVDLESLCNQSGGGPPPTLPSGTARFYFNGEVAEQEKDQTSGHPGSECGGEDAPDDCEDSICALEVVDQGGEGNPDDYRWALTSDSECAEDCGVCQPPCDPQIDNLCGDAREQVPGFRCEKACTPPLPDCKTGGTLSIGPLELTGVMTWTGTVYTFSGNAPTCGDAAITLELGCSQGCYILSYTIAGQGSGIIYPTVVSTSPLDLDVSLQVGTCPAINFEIFE